MSDTSSVGLYLKAEASYGVVAGGNGKALRYTSHSLKQSQETKSSDEITSDRQITDHVRVDIGAEGTTEHEVSAGALDDLLKAGLCSAAWSGSATVTASTISAASADNSINDSGSGFGSFVVGQWIRVTGFTTNGTVFYAKIVTKTTAKLTISGVTLITEAAGASITITQAEYVTNGTTSESFTLQTTFADLSNVYAYWVGCLVDSLQLTIAQKDMIRASIGWLGKREYSSASSQMGTPTAAPTYSVLNTIDDVSIVFEGGFAAANALVITEGSLSLRNNLRKRGAIANLGPIGIGLGDCEVSGAFKIYFATQTLLDKFRNRTASSFGVVLKDSGNRGYVIEVPSIVYSVGEHVVPGKNGDVVASLEFKAKKDATAGHTIRVHRWAS